MMDGWITGWGIKNKREYEEKRKEEILLWKWKTLKTTGWLPVQLVKAFHGIYLNKYF